MEEVPIPGMCRVRQRFDRDGISDVAAVLREKLNDEKLKARIRPGMRVVLTGSSRQIANMPLILKKLAAFVRAQGGEPCIIPAMGSHGGATAEGQKALLGATASPRTTAAAPSSPAWRPSGWDSFRTATRFAWTGSPTRPTR